MRPVSRTKNRFSRRHPPWRCCGGERRRPHGRRRHIAARLEGIAKPGTICLSEDAYRQVKQRLDLAVSDLGPTELKNIADPVRVYSLQVGIPAQAKPAKPADHAVPKKRSSLGSLATAVCGAARRDRWRSVVVRQREPTSSRLDKDASGGSNYRGDARRSQASLHCCAAVRKPLKRRCSRLFR